MTQTEVNPYSYSTDRTAHLSAEPTSGYAATYINALRVASPWMSLYAVFALVTVISWTACVVLAVYEDWRDEELTSFDAIALIVMAFLWSVCWPGYWVFQSTSRIHRAVEDQTLSSIADVLEAQKSFWKSLGILVLLAIAASAISVGVHLFAESL